MWLPMLIRLLGRRAMATVPPAAARKWYDPNGFIGSSYRKKGQPPPGRVKKVRLGMPTVLAEETAEKMVSARLRTENFGMTAEPTPLGRRHEGYANRICLMAFKKQFDTAVKRARARRRTRAALSEVLKYARPGFDIFVMLNSPLLDAKFTDIVAEFRSALEGGAIYGRRQFGGFAENRKAFGGGRSNQSGHTSQRTDIQADVNQPTAGQTPFSNRKTTSKGSPKL